MLDYIPKFGEKVSRGARNAKQMRHLAYNSDIHKSLNETSHDRRRNESGHPAHTHDAEQEEKSSDQDSEGGSERVVLRCTLNGDGADSERRDQTGGGVRSDHQLTRCSK